MKHLQYFQKREPASIAISVMRQDLKNKSRNGNAMKRYKQTLAGSGAYANTNVADRIRNYCMYILMFVLTGHAVLGKFKNCL